MLRYAVRVGACVAAITGTLVIGAGPASAGTVTGTVTSASPNSGLGAVACAAPAVPSTTVPCPGSQVVSAGPGGSYTLTLGAGTWNVAGYGIFPQGIGISAPQEVTVVGTETLTADFVVSPPPVADLIGRITAAGGAPYVGTAAAFGCLYPGPISSTCPGLKLAFAPSDGEYRLQLPPGRYLVGAARWSGPVGPDTQDEITALIDLTVTDGQVLGCNFEFGGAAPDCSGTPPPLDGNGDTIADTSQPNVTSLENAVDEQYVTIASPLGTTLANVQAIDPATLPPPPGGVALPIGVLGFEVRCAPLANCGTVAVDVFTPAGTAPTSYLKYLNGAWESFAGATFDGDRVTLTLTDGGAGDGDGIANGVIVDPGAVGVSVSFDFSGFFRPVDNLPVENVAKAGSAIPVKFSLGGDQGLDIFATGFPTSRVITCGDVSEADGIEETVAASHSGLSYDATTDTYTYVWKTNKEWQGTCRQLVVKLSDDTVHRANFKFT